MTNSSTLMRQFPEDCKHLVDLPDFQQYQTASMMEDNAAGFSLGQKQMMPDFQNDGKLVQYSCVNAAVLDFYGASATAATSECTIHFCQMQKLGHMVKMMWQCKLQHQSHG